MSAPARPLAAPRLGFHAGFWFVAFAFTVVMAFSTLPSPLYGLLEARDDFGSLTVTIIYAVYAVGVLASLVLVGHLSDAHGRRRMLLPALVVAILSAVLFLVWRDLPGLLVARVVNGLAVGVVTATATAWLTELYARHDPQADGRRAQVVATSANLGGLGLGPLIAGALAQWVAHPLAVPFAVMLVALVVSFALVALTPETRRRADPLPPYRPQRVSIPPAGRDRFWAASIAGALAFAATGLFTALTATFLVGVLGETSHLLAGVSVTLVFGSSALAQTLAGRAPLRRLLDGGMLLLALGLALATLATWLGSPSLALYLAGGTVAGIGAGLLFKGSVATVIAVASPERRGEALAGFFVVAYVGISLPVVGAGIVLQGLSARATLLVFAAVVTAGIALISPRLRRNA